MALSIDLDELPSMNEKIKRILENNGISNTMMLSVANSNELVAIGIDSDSAKNLIEEAEELVRRCSQIVFTGESILEALKVEQLKTGCEDLDAILGDGLEIKHLYEFYGESGAGKTDLLIQLACIAIVPRERGGLGTHVLYID